MSKDPEDPVGEAEQTPKENPRPSAPDLRPSAPVLSEAEGFKKSAWGGRRKGAGAKPGNLNGLKHGRYSKQLKTFRNTVADSPAARKAILRWLGGHTTRKHRAAEADKAAALFIEQLRDRLAALDANARKNSGSIKIPDPSQVQEDAKKARFHKIRSSDRNKK